MIAAAEVATASGADADTANKEVDKAIREKRPWLKVYNALKNEDMTVEAKAKHTVWLAKSEAEKGEFAKVSPDGDGVFGVPPKMDRTNQNIVHENCVSNDAGGLAPIDEDKMNVWTEHYARLLNVEFEWKASSSICCLKAASEEGVELARQLTEPAFRLGGELHFEPLL